MIVVLPAPVAPRIPSASRGDVEGDIAQAPAGVGRSDSSRRETTRIHGRARGVGREALRYVGPLSSQRERPIGAGQYDWIPAALRLIVLSGS